MSSSDVRWRATGEGERASGSSKAPPASDADSPPQSEDDEDVAVLTDEKLEKRTRGLPQATDKVFALFDGLLSGVSPRWRNWIVRGIFSWVMIFGFCAIIYKGPLYLMLTVFAIQIKCFSEIISIGYAVYRVHNLPWFRVLSWWFLWTSNYFFFIESLIDHMKILLQKEEFLQLFVTYRRIISFAMYLLGFVGFVLSLKKRYYLRQFSLFAWTHVTLLIVVSQSFFIIQNIFEGMIWFLVPVSMIICNDIMAYIFGFFFGKTPLIKLSPKKTWEGFIGGAFATVLFGLGMSYIMLQYPWYVCPVEYIADNDFTGDCVIPSSFQIISWDFPKWLQIICRILKLPLSIKIYPFIGHTLVMALFASLIGPFGGFFASGFKRAFKIKDFGDVIPGHGGMMDRFDCQLLMGTFVHVYITTFIRLPNPISMVKNIMLMKPDHQLEVYYLLQEKLMSSSLIPNSTAF